MKQSTTVCERKPATVPALCGISGLDGRDVGATGFQRAKRSKDQREVVLTFSYDDEGRRTEEAVTAGTVAGDQQISYAYDGRGRLELVTTYSDAGTTVTSQVEREYDSFGQLTDEHQEHGGTVGGSTPRVQYAYAGVADALRPDSITYPDGRVVSYDYTGTINDTLDRASGLSTGVDTLVSYEYTGTGRMISREHPTTTDPLVLTYEGSGGAYDGFDRFGRIVRQQWQVGSTDVEHLKYGYGRASRRTFRENVIAAVRFPTRVCMRSLVI